MALVPAGDVRIVGGYGLDGLADEWDGDQQVRSRLRQGLNLVCCCVAGSDDPVSGHVDKSMANCKVNSFVLAPILRMMHLNELKLPGIDQVQINVAKIYDFNKVSASEAQIYQDSWAIRRLLHYVKAMLYRTAYPRDWQGGGSPDFFKTIQLDLPIQKSFNWSSKFKISMPRIHMMISWSKFDCACTMQGSKCFRYIVKIQ